MFRNLVATAGGGVNNANAVLTNYTPDQLATYLELSWSAPRSRGRAWRLPAMQTAGAQRLSMHRRMARNAGQIFGARPPLNPAALNAPVSWSHLVYAYMIENTGIVEIFKRVLQAWLSDEKLPFPSLETQYWVRASEELFFKTPSSCFHSLASSLRPDPDGIRANAYQRLLGLELGHDFTGARNAKRSPAIANTEFTLVFERLLCEVWNAYVYRAPGAGPNAADFQAMLQLVRELREMLLARRTHGSLLREEFEAVSMLSWFHLAVEYDTFIVDNLDAQSTSAASRLRRIGALVGVTPAAAADSYFQLADSMSTALLAIESGLVELALQGNAPVLSDPTVSPLAIVMQNIITHWPTITGRHVKTAVPLAIAYPVTCATPVATTANAPVATPAMVNTTQTPAPAIATTAPAKVLLPHTVKFVSETRAASFIGVNRVARVVETS